MAVMQCEVRFVNKNKTLKRKRETYIVYLYYVVTIMDRVIYNIMVIYQRKQNEGQV